MSEPDVTLTDYAIALECALFAILLMLRRTSRTDLKLAGVSFFMFLGLSAATGGTVHGFCSEPDSTACQILWQLTLQLVGLAACSTWILGSRILATGVNRLWLSIAILPLFALYSTLVLLVIQEFWIVFTIYFPAALLLLAAFCRAAWCDGHRFLLVAALGSVLSFLSSFIQFMRVGIDPIYFNHNALAHVVQAVAQLLIFLGIRYITGSDFLSSRRRVRESCT